MADHLPVHWTTLFFNAYIWLDLQVIIQFMHERMLLSVLISAAVLCSNQKNLSRVWTL